MLLQRRLAMWVACGMRRQRGRSLWCVHARRTRGHGGGNKGLNEQQVEGEKEKCSLVQRAALMPNQIFVIAPYWHAGTWVFDDPERDLLQEPFVFGIPEMIDELVKDIPNARQGFRFCSPRNRSPDSKNGALGCEKRWKATGTARMIRRWKDGCARRCSSSLTRRHERSM